MALATGATDHRNRHALVDINHDIKVVVDFFVQKNSFEKHQGRVSKEINKTKHADLFSNRTTKIALEILLKITKVEHKETGLSTT